MNADDAQKTAVSRDAWLLTQGTLMIARTLTVARTVKASGPVAVGRLATFRQKRERSGRIHRRRSGANRIRCRADRGPLFNRPGFAARVVTTCAAATSPTTRRPNTSACSRPRTRPRRVATHACGGDHAQKKEAAPPCRGAGRAARPSSLRLPSQPPPGLVAQHNHIGSDQAGIPIPPLCRAWHSATVRQSPAEAPAR